MTTSTKRSTKKKAAATPAAAPAAGPAELVFPEGLTVDEASDGVVTVVNKHRDLGDIFALGVIGGIAMLFGGLIGGRLFDWPGVAGGLLVTSPLWGWLEWNALRRMVNKTTIVARPGALSVRVGPVGSAGSVELGEGDVASLMSRFFENKSSTRGGSLMVTKTWSVWLKKKGGDELCLVEPLDVEDHARHIEKKLTAALRPKKG